MKYLVLILVIVVVVLLAKGARGRVGQRRRAEPVAPPRPPADATLGEGEVMLACAHCGLHLPRSEALPGRGGVYCSEAHRAIVEARHDAG